MNQVDIAEILLVEDNPNDAEFVLRAFKKAAIPHQITIAIDGEEALKVLPTGKFRLILLDLKLPKVDGLEVLKALKSDPRTSYIPTVVMTSSKEEQDLIETYKLGANSYITKPIDFTEFSEAVMTIGNYWLKLNQLPREI
jgi:two-component system, response regulator